jgi:hypothetical protein
MRTFVFKLFVKGMFPFTLVFDKMGLLLISNSKKFVDRVSRSTEHNELYWSEWNIITLRYIFSNAFTFPKKAKLAGLTGKYRNLKIQNEIKRRMKLVYIQFFSELDMLGVQKRLRLNEENMFDLMIHILNGSIPYPKDLMKYPAGYAKNLVLHPMDCFSNSLKKCKYPIKIYNTNSYWHQLCQSKWSWLMYVLLEERVQYVGEDCIKNAYKMLIKMGKNELTFLKKKGVIQDIMACHRNTKLVYHYMMDYWFNISHEELITCIYNRSIIENISRAIKWHKECELIKEREYDYPMPRNECPDELEQYRIKTRIDMIMAGRENHHCIGGYADPHSPYIFLIKGSVCAQLVKTTSSVYVNNEDIPVLSIRQCYDACNKETPEQQKFVKKINSILDKEAQKTAEKWNKGWRPNRIDEGQTMNF